MSTEEAQLPQLLARFNELERRDRRAVLAELTVEERRSLEIALAAEAQIQRDESVRVQRMGRQFAGYSPWLGEIVRQSCEGPEPADASVNEAVRRAISEIHDEMYAEAEPPPGDLFSRAKQWAENLFAVQREPQR